MKTIFFFKDYTISRPFLMKPAEEIGKADGSKISSRASISSPTPPRYIPKIDQDPEYKSIYRRPPLPSQPIVPAGRPTNRQPYSIYDPSHQTIPICYPEQHPPSHRGNYWMDKGNRDRFGQVNAKNEQDSFQLLDTRLHHDSVIGKPPPVTR